MAFEDFKTKDAVIVVYTGDGKGKTSASVGLLARALGRDWKVAYVQFVKTWETGESKFIDKVVEANVFGDKLFYFRGGKGFYNAGDISAKDVTEAEHKKAAEDTYAIALEKATSGDYDLVICDEKNNSVHDGLLPVKKLEELLTKRSPKTSICVTGRNFPKSLLKFTDIATDMTKIKHHFDDKFLANKGIDY
ncbi:MAG: cob(I)yrinic acid a,c-diamide adenosyltransferase [Candidatus Saccharibacteria bacterium]|nr:cob(I)yrinic acid a,c-diamide adenosyltransferase [Candidatus Saccharibacteria bacterium]